jgi:hypothetical protein
MLSDVNIFNQPFVQVALPIVITLWITMTLSNKRVDDLAQLLRTNQAEIVKRLEAIETRLTSMERKVDALELKAWR